MCVCVCEGEKVRGGALEVCGPPLLMVAKCFLGLCFILSGPSARPHAGCAVVPGPVHGQEPE